MELNIYKITCYQCDSMKKFLRKRNLFPVWTEHSHSSNCVVMLQNCVGLINDERVSGSEACVTALGSGTEEGNVEVEEENAEVIINTPVQPKHEVSEWVLCIGQNVSCFQEHLLPQKEKF